MTLASTGRPCLQESREGAKPVPKVDAGIKLSYRDVLHAVINYTGLD
jgi:hypothetical protein